MSRSRELRRVHAGDQTIQYTLVRDVRRRHSHLFLDEAAGPELRAPSWMDAEEADRLVARNAQWLSDTQARQLHAQAAKPTLADGVELPFLDDRLRLSLGAGHRWHVRRHAQQLHVRGPAIAGPRLDDEALRVALERWYRVQAADIFWPRLLQLGAAEGLQPEGITIRAQRSRWGSCSSRGHINLNWRLMLLPSALADYVLVHELCHLRHMDHSRAFRTLLAKLLPDYRVREQRLNAVRGSGLAI
jgi:predicted metal-dependent hydrolase